MVGGGAGSASQSMMQSLLNLKSSPAAASASRTLKYAPELFGVRLLKVHGRFKWGHKYGNCTCNPMWGT